MLHEDIPSLSLGWTTATPCYLVSHAWLMMFVGGARLVPKAGLQLVKYKTLINKINRKKGIYANVKRIFPYYQLLFSIYPGVTLYKFNHYCREQLVSWIIRASRVGFDSTSQGMLIHRKQPNCKNVIFRVTDIAII